MTSRSSTRRSTALLPTHHANKTSTLFKNPWPSADKPTWSEFLTLSNPLSWYNAHDLHKNPHAREIKVVTPDWGASNLKARNLDASKSIIGTWVGHAGVLVSLPLSGLSPTTASSNTRLTILFDPIFSPRAGPNQYTGPSRFKPSPCSVSSLPACDAVAISHNHYDHLDLSTIKGIYEKFPKCKFFVPLGNKSWLVASGVPGELVYELDWSGDVELGLGDFGLVQDEGKERTVVRFTCVPAQHNSGRGTLDQGSTLWCGWVVEQFLHPKKEETDKSMVKRTRKGAVYHAGDTGYRRTAKSEEVCPVFADIGKKFGPFDLSFIPIWRGGTLGFISYVGLRLSHQEIPSALHASPADAMDIHKVVNSRNTIGVHFGTFIGSENESYEATIEFEEAREKKGVESIEGSLRCENGRAGVLDIGGSIAVEIEVR